MKLTKKKIIFTAGIIISIVCSWLFIRKVEWGSLGGALKDANYIYVIPVIIIILSTFYLRAVRWSILITPVKKVPLGNLLSATMIGFMANNVLPARMGEVIKPIMIGKKENIKFSAAFATVVMERIFDLLSLIVFATVVFLLLPYSIPGSNNNTTHTVVTTSELKTENLSYNPKANTHGFNENKKTNLTVIKQLKKWSVIFAAFGIFGIIFLFLLTLYPKIFLDIVHKIVFFLPHHFRDTLVHHIDSFISGLQIFNNKKQLLWTAFLSFIIWMLNAVAIYILGFSFNLELSFLGACFVIVCLSIAVALPQAPGFIGVFHIAIQKSLDIFGVELSSAQSYAIILWAISFIPVTIIGLLYLWKEGMGLGDITKQEEQYQEKSSK